VSKPICYDGYCVLGGWSEGFLSEGYRCVGFDIEAHDYGTGGYPGELILRDMRQVHGSELKDAACLVFSPPCQEYSYMAMPWSRSKQIARALQGKDEFPEGYSGSRSVEQLNELFNTCFRIQREACEAAGHYIPMVIENVRGAQKWVGRAKAHYGSFFLWGDVGMVGNRVVAIVNGKILGRGVAPIRAQKFNPDGTQHGAGSWFAIANSQNRGANAEKVPSFRFDGSGGSFQSAAVETVGRSLSKGALKWGPHNMGPGEEMMAEIAANQRESDAVKGDGSGWTEKGSLKSHNRLVANTGVKQHGSGAAWWDDALNERRKEATAVKNGGDWFGSGDNAYEQRKHGSKSSSRKAASALIAKIPFALSQYIAQSFKPEEA